VPLRIYDTLTREKREFTPVTPGRVTMYVCGMTVQNRPHVGHIRASLSGEVMRRYLEHLGYQVVYAYNFTDVDDKIIARANQEGIEYASVSERNIEAYLQYADLHNIKRATIYPRATQHIGEMHAVIHALIDKGYAYVAGGDVYFDVRRKTDYGKLSGRRVDDLREGYRIEPGEAKRDPLDFALWKGAKPGEPAWDSPWGPGRPGWHIECSAMAMKHLGETIDIHGGGQDLVFPHHENEMAQSEACTGRPFANYWAENGLVNLGGSKMSKSDGNFFFIEDVAAKVDPEVTRYYLLSTHYRSPIEFSLERLSEAGVAYRRLRATLERAGAWTAPSGSTPRGVSSATPAAVVLDQAVVEAERLFHEAMQDDFNTAEAIGHLQVLAAVVNRGCDGGRTAEATQAARALLGLGSIIGLFWKSPATEEWSAQVLELAKERETARRERNWKRSDEFRDALSDLGVLVEDGPKGQNLKRK
jgi:cysteinyl-tRNA synthetase